MNNNTGIGYYIYLSNEGVSYMDQIRNFIRAFATKECEKNDIDDVKYKIFSIKAHPFVIATIKSEMEPWESHIDINSYKPVYYFCGFNIELVNDPNAIQIKVYFLTEPEN